MQKKKRNNAVLAYSLDSGANLRNYALHTDLRDLIERGKFRNLIGKHEVAWDDKPGLLAFPETVVSPNSFFQKDYFLRSE